ncbi:phospholipid:diacylglycerol acyltransferase [Lecanora helva]
MSTLRRRFLGDTSSEPSRDPSPVNGEPVTVIPASQLQKLKTKSRSKRRTTVIFGLGGLFGIIVAAFFAQQHDVINLEGLVDFNLESLLDVIPAGIVNDAKDITRHEREAVNYDSFSVGLHLQSQGVKALHPVIMVPGVISTGLESWSTEADSRQYFRKRLWGSWSMMRALVTDKKSWKKHIMLDKTTGLDPPGVKLRAAQGFDAADFFITGYWIWNKILENLAVMGYDPSTNAFTAAYDWRLSCASLENRDGYFSRLRSHIETALSTNKQKVVLISHSMGSQVLFYFFHWVEAPEQGGPGWVDKFVESWINVSGSMLGALKGLPAVLSGEMKDTAQLNAFAVYGLEKFVGRDERCEIFRTMPGASSMLPKGGNAVWGNKTWAPDDRLGQNVSFGTFINFREHNSTRSPGNLTVEESIDYLLKNSDTWYQDQIENNYSNGVAHTSAEVEDNERDHRKWMNPLESRLPLAPNLKIYCFYGVGKATERSYFYREDQDPLSKLNVTIDTSLSVGTVDHGVILGEGDGTVPLLSNGYMCAKGWHMKRYNPAGIKIKVYEMPHEPDRFSPRGGPNTGDHVDILGRSSLNDLILRVAGGKGDQIEENYVSDIRKYAERVKIYEEDHQSKS